MTRIVSIALKMLKKLCPGIRVVVSYADRDQGHEGKIYRAGNWINHGECFDEHYLLFGKKVHSKSVFDKYGTRSIDWLVNNVDSKCCRIKTAGKVRYVYFLKCAGSIANDVPAHQAGEGGANPTPALQSSKGTQ